MTFLEFTQSIRQEVPPLDLPPVLKSLWWDGKGDWQTSHEIAQEIETPDGNRIHAYLHRKEGDRSNAMYWYSRAGRPYFDGSLQSEWEILVREYLPPRH